MSDGQGSQPGIVEQLLQPASRDLGDGFTVRRALPARERRTVGPFVFFDSMGPTLFDAGGGLDVRPHPHIGLATVTYLFDGEVLHRDSLGNEQPIRPAEVNWMIAGRGIVHSERTPMAMRGSPSALSGIQAWVGLPRKDEEMPPAFAHHPSAQLPQLAHAGVRLRLIAGTLGGARSPVATLSPMFYADAELQPGATLKLDREHAERALFIAEGTLEIERQLFEAGRMLVFRAQGDVLLAAHTAARVLLLGGAPLDGVRHLWWNFVASSPERMQRAAEDWRSGRFGRVPGDAEFIPLPQTRPPWLPPGGAEAQPVNYP